MSSRRAGPKSVGGLGGFGGGFTIPPGYREPLMIASTDGVGTKTAIAAAIGRYDTIGIDLVAMCADDVVCAGAEPLAFLDYVAVGRLDPGRGGGTRRERRDGVSRGRGRAGRRGDGGAPRADGRRRLRSRRLLHRRRGAGPGHRRLRGPRRRRHPGHGVEWAPRQRVLARPVARRPVGPRPRRALPGPVAADARRRRVRRFARRRTARGDGHAGRGPPDADPDLRARRARRACGRRRCRRRPPRTGAHHGWRAARECAAGTAGRARRPAGPEPLADAVGHAPVRRPRGSGRRGVARHLQRRARAWSPCSPRPTSLPRSTRSAAHGIAADGRR